MTKPKVLILHAPGTNRDNDLAYAIRAAGGEPEIKPLSTLDSTPASWNSYGMVALPGGFSYGDALGAGRLWALALQTAFQEALQDFVSRGRAVIGICNGFQALVKGGILPGGSHQGTLTFNASGHFECRWVRLLPNQGNPSPWLSDLPPLYCPVAHGEGRFLAPHAGEIPGKQIALQYALDDGSLADGCYPANPNGSPLDIAGITNAAGNVLGLMPHPENHILTYQHPSWTRGGGDGLCIRLFQNGLRI